MQRQQHPDRGRGHRRRSPTQEQRRKWNRLDECARTSVPCLRTGRHAAAGGQPFRWNACAARPTAKRRGSRVKRRALIVDDEKEARKRLARMLTEFEDRIEVIGDAIDGPAAVEAIQNLKPDVVFLDIEMPGLDGFDVLDSLSQD